MRIGNLILYLAILGGATLPRAVAALTDAVLIEQGKLVGSGGRGAEVRVYKGIPFAAPPVAGLRWKPPQPPDHWQGVRRATEFGDSCPQPPYPSNGLFAGTTVPISEDCLYLNIWTPAKSAGEQLPVMVWIHGGGFDRGTGSASGYDGENLARKGVVVVTINYRLGLLGLLALPELAAESPHHSSGNYGLMDQIAALGWVQRNIAAFGGDARRVTIFGQSAGSVSVSVLMASPLAKGLFMRAIGESGGSFGLLLSLADAERQGLKVAEELGVKQDVLKSLRAMSTTALVQSSANNETVQIIDGWVLRQSVYAVFRTGQQNHVPLIVGNNRNEGGNLATLPTGRISPAEFTASARKDFGSLADKFLEAYPAGTSEDAATAAHYASFRDGAFGWDMRTWARMETQTGHGHTYRYYFTRVPPGRAGARLGAFHGAELAYVFENFTFRLFYVDVDKQLGEAISSYWVNFAKTGDPNGAGLPPWPVYDRARDDVLEFGDEVKVQFGVNAAGLDFFDIYNQSLRSAFH